MKQKTPEFGADARLQIAETLPIAIEKAIHDYHRFIDEKNTEETHDFKNHHVAAKAGLAHIELLMKLATMVDALDQGQENNLLELLASAKDELKNNA